MTDELVERLARLHRHYESGGMGGEPTAKILQDASARIIADAKIIDAADALAQSLSGDVVFMDCVHQSAAAYRAAVSERDT